jgi:hypothetical protein
VRRVSCFFIQFHFTKLHFRTEFTQNYKNLGGSRDHKIITGEAFDQAIERELETAKSIVVLWSEHSIVSEWVKSEAAVASERGVLVPALIDSVKLPLEFRRKQTADLIGWDGEPSHGGFQALCEGLSARIGIHRQWMSEDSAQWVGRARWNVTNAHAGALSSCWSNWKRPSIPVHNCQPFRDCPGSQEKYRFSGC